MVQQVTRFTAVMYDDAIRKLNEVDRNRASVTRDCVDRYFFIVEQAKPSLKSKIAEGEIDAIADLFNGSLWFFSCLLPLIPKRFDDILHDKLLAHGERNDIDVEDLTKRLAGLPIDEKFALIHEAETRQRKSQAS